MEKPNDFDGLVKYYKERAKNGNYHNPYDVSEEIEKKALESGIEPYNAEEIAFEIGNLFWDM